MFENVTVRKNANIYYDGKLTSRTLLFDDGTRKTLGFVLPGSYDFSTNCKEVVDVYSGCLTISYGGNDNEYYEGDTFSIPAKTDFVLKTDRPTDFCTSFIEV